MVGRYVSGESIPEMEKKARREQGEDGLDLENSEFIRAWSSWEEGPA